MALLQSRGEKRLVNHSSESVHQYLGVLGRAEVILLVLGLVVLGRRGEENAGAIKVTREYKIVGNIVGFMVVVWP